MAPVKKNTAIKVNILNLQDKLPVNKLFLSKIKKAASQALAVKKGKFYQDICVCIVDNKAIQRLNAKYFGKDQPTDVIAFNTGDIAVSTDAAAANAGIFKTRVSYELLLYVVHGVLHILGYDDRTACQRKHMQLKAEGILKKAGINNADK